MADHYATLGVDGGADAGEIRSAYLRRARALHPDRYSDRSHDEAARAERAMQQVNEAFRVLGNADRKAAYDRARAGAVSRPRPTSDDGPRYVTVEDIAARAGEPTPVGALLVRMIPWLALAVVGIAIFVYSAVAGGPADDETNPVRPSIVGDGTADCLVDEPPGAIVPCSRPNDGPVADFVPDDDGCRGGTRLTYFQEIDLALCVSAFGDPSG